MKYALNLLITVVLTMLAIYVIKMIANKTDIPILKKIVQAN